MMVKKNSPSRYDIRVVKNVNYNSDLVGIAAEKVAELEIGSRGSTESRDSKDLVKDLGPTPGALVSKFTSKRASTNL